MWPTTYYIDTGNAQTNSSQGPWLGLSTWFKTHHGG